MTAETSILLIYTGGTVGMIRDEVTGTLKPFNIGNLIQYIPEISRFGFTIDTYSFDPPLDSSNISVEEWVRLASLIEEKYNDYDGFVVLHGSDTMAFTASAMSFMLENLGKPVIFTGSQLPASVLRTDARENLLTSIEIAAAKNDAQPIVPEVCIYFEYELFRGNRTYKFNAENFDAFRSVNYPPLAEAGVSIKYSWKDILPVIGLPFKAHLKMDTNIAVIHLFPGIQIKVIEQILETPDLKAVVLETYGSGNASTNEEFINVIKKAVDKGLIIYNVTQCRGGGVDQERYETSIELKNAGVISGRDITFEAAVAKLMFLLGNEKSPDTIKSELGRSIRGEMS